MKRTDMVRAGAEQLIVAEKAVETAMAEVATLTGDLARMRVNGNLSLGLGRDAMKSLTSSISLLNSVREEMIEAHKHLDVVKTQMGCRTVMTGHLDKPEGDGSQPPKGLHVVAERQSA